MKHSVSLPGDSVHVWSFSLAAPPAQLHARRPWLTPEEEARVGHWSGEEQRRRFLATRIGLRALLARYLDCTPARVRFGVTAEGKPHLVASGHKGFRFNIAHSADLALVAITRDREVGIDLEALRENIDFEGLAPVLFSSSELAYWRALPPSERTKEFFVTWVGKEAWLKAIGCGLRRPMATLALGDLVSGRDLSYRHYPVTTDPGFVAALVVAGPAVNATQSHIDYCELLGEFD